MRILTKTFNEYFIMIITLLYLTPITLSRNSVKLLVEVSFYLYNPLISFPMRGQPCLELVPFKRY